ncbi:lectin C-type domain containing isoform 1 precursor, partial [Silurus meridionalis]
ILLTTGVVSVMSVLQSVYYKYYLINTMTMTWADAKNYCREKYDDIAILRSSDDWIKIKEEGAAKSLTAFAWIGLYNDIESWRWSFNDVPLKNQTLRMWYAGEPKNENGNEACGVLGQLGQWWDYPCTDLRPFICYNSSTDKIIPVASLMSWYGAQAYCRKYYTDLASSTTATQNSQLEQVFLLQGSSWFGLFRDTWKWVDNPLQDATNLQWYTGQPNNFAGNEDCVVIFNGLLVDRPCMNLNFFFCHTSVSFALIIQDRIEIAPLLIKQNANWIVAQNYCRENYLDLYTITNETDQQMLLKEMTDKNVMGPVWIGLYNDLDTWYWSYNHLPLKNMSLIKWAPGNPDNTSGADMCGVVQDVGKWESYPCFYTGPFIC